METTEKTALIKAVLDDKKAVDVTALSLASLSTLSDSFVIASGTSVPHVRALADEVRDKLSEQGLTPLRVEGYQSARWVLLDYGDVVVHIFNPEARSFYGLDRLWGDAQR